MFPIHAIDDLGNLFRIDTSRRDFLKRLGVAGLVAAAGAAVPARSVAAARPASARIRAGTSLLFYAARAGHGAFYATDGAGGIRLLAAHGDWDRTWTHVVPGKFGGDGFTDLLFYDRAAARAAVYASDGASG